MHLKPHRGPALPRERWTVKLRSNFATYVICTTEPFFNIWEKLTFKLEWPKKKLEMQDNMKYPFSIISMIPSSSSFPAPLLPPVWPELEKISGWAARVYTDLARLPVINWLWLKDWWHSRLEANNCPPCWTLTSQEHAASEEERTLAREDQGFLFTSVPMCSVLNVASGNQACTMLHKKHTVNIAIYEIMCAATSKSSDWIKSFFHSDVFYLLKRGYYVAVPLKTATAL